MNKNKFFIFSFLLCGMFGLHAQQTTSYYYKGNQVTLPINSQHFFVYVDTFKVSLSELYKEFNITESVSSTDENVIGFQFVTPNNNYDSVVRVLHNKEYIVDIEPVIGDTILRNTSRLFYVKMHQPSDYELLQITALNAGVDIVCEVPYNPNWYRLKVNKFSVVNSIETANFFWETGYFADIDPGFIFHFQPRYLWGSCVSDSRFTEQWGMEAINNCSAWKITRGDTNINVAVIDKGIDVRHVEFDSSRVVFSYDVSYTSSPANVYCSQNRNRTDPHENPYSCHGTQVGGIIFANHNRFDVVGVAPKTSMINISHSLIVESDNDAEKLGLAINLAVENGARVINNSWGDHLENDYLHTPLIEQEIDCAIARQCVVVFAAGNCGVDMIDYPASYNQNILVSGAISKNRHRWSGSSYGIGLDVVAPGDSILTTNYNNDYSYKKGTSMAAPHVSGVAGLMFSINPELTGKNVRDIIEQTAQKLPYYVFDSIAQNGSWDMFIGYGLLDAHRAVLKAAYHKVYGDTALTLCDTNRHAYTVHAPHNANIDSVSFFWTCSDNLQMVAGQTTDSVWVKRVNSGDGVLQCHIIHDGDTVVSTLDILVISDRTVYDNMSLNNGVTFPDTFVLSREIVIDSLSGLTWQDKTVLCTPDCRIIIRPGGAVLFDHTKLTSACPNRMWQGVEVMGDPTKLQTQQNQGVLHIENGSVIENAYTAVRNRQSTDGLNATTGGVIHAQSSTFRNNSRAVEIYPYAYSSQPGQVSNYFSSFRQCTFTLNDRNIFAANDTVFTEHVRLWGVKGLTFKGCGFFDSTSAPILGRRGIYTEDAGLILDTYCDMATTECVCPENHATYCSFFGFTTAVEVNTTGDQYPVTVNQVRFRNNLTDLKINGNQFATVTRNIFNLSDAPFASMSVVGLDLNGCTGYKVEADTFLRDLNNTSGTAKGVAVHNSMAAPNTVFRNYFKSVDYGIYVSGANGNWKNGLQILCNGFKMNGTDIHIASNSTLYSYQGNSNRSAGNTFDKKVGLDIVNDGTQNVNYYYTGGTTSVYYPDQCTGLVTRLSTSKANPCSSTLCNNGGGFTKSLSEFQSDMDAVTYYESVRTIMSDSVLDLNELEQWHTVAQPIADPYSLTETRFMMGYSEPFVADADDAELANYADFHAMKLVLRNSLNDNMDNADNNSSPRINWYALTPAQIAQLQTIAERNAGRASVMAKGVLCFFFGICYDDELLVDDNADSQDNDGDAEPRSAKAVQQVGEASLNVYPNPTDDILYVELSGAGIQSAGLYDLQGRVVADAANAGGHPAVTFNVRNVPAGVYVLRVTDENGKEYHQKVVVK